MFDQTSYTAAGIHNYSTVKSLMTYMYGLGLVSNVFPTILRISKVSKLPFIRNILNIKLYLICHNSIHNSDQIIFLPTS